MTVRLGVRVCGQDSGQGCAQCLVTGYLSEALGWLLIPGDVFVCVHAGEILLHLS